jgi:hypothetical protein
MFLKLKKSFLDDVFDGTNDNRVGNLFWLIFF